MKFIAFCFCSFALSITSCSNKQRLYPDFQVTPDTIFFQTMKFNDTLRTYVSVKNLSQQPLKINAIETGCGCTTAQISDSLVNSQDSLRLDISYIPMLSNDSGKITKVITIRTNSSTPFKNIFLKGTILK